MYIVYILKSEVTGRHYIGQTQDLTDRIRRHNESKSKSTKNRGPYKLIYTEEFNTRSEAVRREKYLKSLKGKLGNIVGAWRRG